MKISYKNPLAYDAKSFCFSKVKTVWPVQNNVAVRTAINELNYTKRASLVFSLDFSTLDTNMPQNMLKYPIKEVKDICFKVKQGRYIVISEYGGTWTNDTNKYNLSFDKKSPKLAINYFLEQCFFIISSLTFCQNMNIPMGSDPAPFRLISFFLHMNLNGRKLKGATYRNQENSPTHFAL